MIDCKHVRELAKQRGITMRELSYLMRFKRETGIYHLLDGDPRQSSLERLALLLDCSVPDLLIEPSQFGTTTLTCPHCGRTFVLRINIG